MSEIRTSGETQIEFNRHYQYVWLKNIGTGDCYVSDKPHIQAEADGVSFLPVGGIVMITMLDKDIYVLGDTIVECHAQEYSSCPFGEVGGSGGGSEAVLITKSVIQNGVYNASSDNADGYKTVNVSVSPNVDSKNITQNGTYTASSENLDGYSSVSVDVPIEAKSSTITQNGTYTASTDDLAGYSSVTVDIAQDVEIITRTAWNALTPAQKQAKGLVAIQDNSTGYERGEFVNGADYVQKNRYIPNSNEDDVLCEAYVSNFDATATSWGNGDVPIQYMSPSNKPTLDTTENAVLAAAYSSGAVPYIDLGASNTSFTAYAVIRQSAAFSSYPRLLSCMYSRSASNGIVLYNNSNEVIVSKWGDELPTVIITANQYFVVAIRNENTSPSTNTTDVYLYNGSEGVIIVKKTEEPTNMGQYFTIARTDIDSNTMFAEASDVYIRYLAVVQGVESENTIGLNMQNIYNEFIASE